MIKSFGVALTVLSCFLLRATLPPAHDEAVLVDYFRSTASFLHKEGRHADFRTFEEHDMSNYWGFFQLPVADEMITGPDAITCQYCDGDGIYTLSRLLDFTLARVQTGLKESGQEEPYRLGFFKMFRDRLVHRPYDAYLHYLNGGGRLFLTLPNAEQLIDSRPKLDRLVRQLCEFLSNDHQWSSQFVGLTMLYSEKNELRIELWTGPECTFAMLRQLKKEQEGRVFFADGETEIRLLVEGPETVMPEEDKAAEVRALFLGPEKPACPEVESQIYPTTWLALAAAHKQGITGGNYELSRLIQRRSSLIHDSAAFDRLCLESLFKFPGILAKNSSTILLKKDILTTQDEELVLGGGLFTINFRPAVHQSHSTAVHGLPTYGAYAVVFYLAAKYFMQTPNINLDAVFFHFNIKPGGTMPKQAELSIEVWTKKSAKNNQINNIRTGLSDYLYANLTE